MKTAISSQPNKDVLEAEVPPEILEQFKILNSTIEKNNSFAQDFLLNSSIDDLQKLDFEVFKIIRLLNDLRSVVRKERIKNHTLSENVVRDEQMAEQVNRRYDILTKNPQFGRSQTVEYLHTIISEHENNLINYKNTIAKVEETLQSLMNTDKETSLLTQRDLSEHIQRFDQIFNVVASQVYYINEEVEKLKDAFLEQQTKIYGRYARNPFEKRKDRQKMFDAFSNLKGLDAFPSQNAVLSISEFLPKQQTSVPTSGSLFGNTNIGGANSGLFFNKPAVPTTTGTFNLFDKTATSVTPFTTTTTTTTSSIFGTTSTALSNNWFSTSKSVSQPFSGSTLSTGFGAAQAATGFGAAQAATGFGTAQAATGFGATQAATGFGAKPTATGFGGFSNSNASNTGGTFNFGTIASGTQPATGLFGNTSTAGASFGNTINSASSGTLFSSSAPSAQKSLFGSK